jgi:hypothetical protein
MVRSCEVGAPPGGDPARLGMTCLLDDGSLKEGYVRRSN